MAAHQLPDSIEFQTKPGIAIELIKKALGEDVPSAIVLADAGYGNDTGFKEKLNGLKIVYAVGTDKKGGGVHINVTSAAVIPANPGRL